jgi:hypothetical protein
MRCRARRNFTQQSIDAIEQFFRAFESDACSHDTGAQVSHFADTFMAATPQGAQSVRVSDFALALPRKKQFFDMLGCRSTALASLRQTRLDARYVMASTQWRMTFAQDHREPQDVTADSVYIVDTGTEPFKIVFYLASQDLVQILKDRGIAPA